MELLKILGAAPRIAAFLIDLKSKSYVKQTESNCDREWHGWP